MDSSDEECNNSSLKINVGQTFHTWEDAEKFLNEYGLEKGFSIRRRRTESQISDNGNKMIQRVGWECGNAGSKVYNPILQEINSTQQNYDRAQGLIQKSINIAIAVNSYDKFIGICHGFILDKQRNQKLKIEIEDVANIKNPIITT
ncbi:16247_t:CDS:2 [Funneliformis geosporum]|nr:16247_t:CDS:2 [Funneliformis geosporum]